MTIVGVSLKFKIWTFHFTKRLEASANSKKSSFKVHKIALLNGCSSYLPIAGLDLEILLPLIASISVKASSRHLPNLRLSKLEQSSS